MKHINTFETIFYVNNVKSRVSSFIIHFFIDILKKYIFRHFPNMYGNVYTQRKGIVNYRTVDPDPDPNQNVSDPPHWL